MRNPLLYMLMLLTFLAGSHTYALPQGDTSGTVSAVRVRNVNANEGIAAFEIWFNSVSRDRWGCLANDGYILVRQNGIGVNAESFQMMFSVALAAQTAGKKLVVDSSGTNPCLNVNNAWME